MRLLFLSMEYPPETGGGGIGSYVACIAPALSSRGHEVHVLSCVRAQETRDYKDQGVCIHRRSQVRLRGLGRLLRSPEAGTRLETAVSGWIEMRRLGLQFDVVEFPDWMAEGLVLGLAGSLPLVAHLHTPLHLIRTHNGLPLGWDTRLGDLLERSAVRRADVVTAPSRLIASELKRSGWTGATAVEVVPYPIDLERWQRLPETFEAKPTVLAVGRLEPRKAPELLLRAAASLTSEVPDLEVIFVGRSSGTRDGLPYQKWLERIAGALMVRVHFAGQVPRNELREWYARARVVAISSWYDNFPMVGLEGMACGRPVVCTSRTGLAELVGHGGGCVVPPGDSDALAAALLPYLLDPALAEAEGGRARGVVGAARHPAVVAERREAVYRAAIERHEYGRAARVRWFRSAARFAHPGPLATRGRAGSKGRSS